jgi:Na+/glutamate symporter
MGAKPGIDLCYSQRIKGLKMSQRTTLLSMVLVPVVSLVLLGGSPDAAARGCLKGAAVGAVAGHVAGHHAVVGAVAGCAVGHHLAKKQLQQQRLQQRQLRQPQSPQPAQPAAPAPDAGAITS